jgi:hypothetical protein
MDRFDFSVKSLTDLISTHYFSVPRYQRSYAWTEDEIADYWSDIMSAIKDGGDYFLGNIVLTENSGKDSFDIIDGQQRIATTTILNCAIRDIYIVNGENEIATAIQQEMICAFDTTNYQKIPRIILNEIDNPFYKEMMIDKKNPTPNNESHILIKSAYDFFHKKLSELNSENPSNWKSEFGKIAKFFKNQSRVVTVYAANDADAFTIFETLNDRGADLTISDLLKNYLFSKAGNEIDSVQNYWIETRSILSEYQKEGEFITFLRHYWSSVYGMTRERELYRDIKSEVTQKSQAVKLAKDMRDAARLYGAALSDKAEYWKDYTETDRSNFQQLLRLKLEQNRPLLIAIFQHFPKDQIQKTIPSLVSWSVRGLITGVMGKGAAETTFCEAATKIRSGNIKTRDDLAQSLSGLIPGDSAFSNAFTSYRTTNNSFARYLLLGLERGLSGEKQPELIPNSNVDEVNLEHVLPRKANKNEWSTFKEDEMPFYAFRLGNMTLLKEKSNNDLGNKPFAVKKPILAASKLKINSVFGVAPDWDKGEIEKRQTIFGLLAVGIWKL